MGSGSAFPFKQRRYNPPLQEVSDASRSSLGVSSKSLTVGRQPRPRLALFRLRSSRGRALSWLLTRPPGARREQAFSFAFFGVNSRYRDFTPIKKLCLHRDG